ncbi:sensor histidine kinase [Argonema antarcticum]|uniref:sensor histidine kinase n=1 Tax=Argonema antarcticum TaxID=2942763 RepID=UPI00201264A2|nr:HAMP domain-containing sensor histidine kinase [Argonema antarcticum]MCL1474949.1 HAMP domain-containing histidine kinase [Argonema antarcticum A004/B2]
MPASSEFVALCQAQVALLTQALGAALSVVYLTEELVEGEEAKLIPVVAYPNQSAVWDENDSLAFLPDGIEKVNNIPRLLSAAPQGSSILLRSGPGVDATGGEQRRHKEGHSLVQQRQIVLPLIHEGVVMGLLVTSREDRPWNEQERIEVERIAHTMALACILDQRSQWLGQQFSQQQRLQSQQNELLHNLLHQLRNPLTALLTFGKLLLKRLRPSDANRDIAANILRESDRIQDLLSQFDEAIDLTASQGSLLAYPSEVSVEGEVETATDPDRANKPLLLLPEGGLMAVGTLESCSVAEVLKPLLSSAYAIAQERNIKLKAEIRANLTPVRANPKALTEVFSNLIDNALKYTPSGGWVYVDAGVERESPQGRLQGVAVSDTGPGIPPQDLERLFERHYRGVQARSEIPGTGLGLAIARDLVQQMQGEIEVFSPSQHPTNAGIGSTFIVWLPESQ